MQSDTAKQHLLLRGIPVAVRAALALQKATLIDAILVVTRKEDIPVFQEYKRSYQIDKIIAVTEGGATRRESALNGILAMPDKYRYVAIHDAARCLTDPRDIDRVVTEGIRHGAASLAIPAVDTVKFVGKTGLTLTENQPPRGSIRQMQTPQVFLADLYRAAAYTAHKDGFEATDDCSLIEHIGKSCFLTEGSERNIKITTPLDLKIAEALLEDSE